MLKGALAAVAALCLSPLLLAGLSGMAYAAHDSASGDTDTVCTDSTSAAASKDLAKAVAALVNGKKASGTVKGLSLPAEQIPNARTIVSVGIALKVPARGQVVALATAVQESRLRNLASGDRDSVGLFQQRPSQGWGSVDELHTPRRAATLFYQHLLKVPGWQQLTVTQAAQAVQNSGHPTAYAQWEPLAHALQHTLATTGSSTAAQPTDKDSAADAGCTASPTGKDAGASGSVPTTALPEGYTIPRNIPAAKRTAITWALQQLGTPYQWGGTCTAAHGQDPMGRCDCSSLMQQAYKAADITLTRTTYTQVNEGHPISLADIRPGDLIFTEGSAARPEHVGMYIGGGYLVNAPRTGLPVRVESLASWASGVLAVRRIDT
ncbi:C40 family peptidase [Streptomyces sp. NPDC050085]|uniref:C40 family peptidase n=1 Tax=Streptomyces sp. NPDC050085 TaxID=3365600 RepID=UPI00378A55CE